LIWLWHTHEGRTTVAYQHRAHAFDERLYDNLDFQRGVQAFLTAMPAASLAA
jgi:hypothetical protein